MTPGRLAVAAAVILGLAGCSGSSASDARPSAIADEAPVALFLGDSYTEGMGLAADELDSRWSAVLADRLGWRERNAGCSGSGYSTRGPECSDNYGERVAELADADPDVVIVSGGVNDLYESADVIDASVRDTYAALRSAFPEARIYAVNGIYFHGDETPEILLRLNESVKHWSGDSDAVFLDIGEPFLGHPELLGDDRVHPNPAGHEVLADLTQAELERVGASEVVSSAG